MTASTTRSTKTVGQLVAERPERGRVFELLGIDYCCGGRKPLAEACAQRGLDLGNVCAQLDAADASTSASTEPDWTTAPLARLADHIKTMHHDTMRRELPRLAAIVQKVAGVHGRGNPSLIDLDEVFAEFSKDLHEHMAKEESVLFPWISGLESNAPGMPTRFPLSQPIRRMMDEHDDAGKALGQMRELTNGFTPPMDACGTYRVMLSGLRDLEADMHIHVHKENNILFPRALSLEANRHRGS